MKKILLIILTFALFIFPLINVRASGFVIDPTTLSSLTSGAESLQYISIAQNGYVPVNGVTSKDLNDLLRSQTQKATRYEITESDITSVVPLSESPYELASVVDTWEMFYLNGDPVLSTDFGELRYCTFDNGYFSGECIVAPNGQLVARNVTGTSNDPIANIHIGGSQMTYDEYVQAIEDTATYLSENNYSYNSNGASVNPSFYLFYGVNKRDAESLYIPNMFLPGQVVPTNTNVNTIISSWYTNDLSLFNHSVLMGNTFDYNISEGSYTKNGYNYRYRVSFGTRGQSNNSQINYSTWSESNVLNPCFGKTNTVYTSDMLSYESMSISTYLPTEGDIEGNLSLAIPLDEALTVAGTIAGVLPYPNVAYDPDLPISDTNRAVVVPMDIAIDDTPVIPVPEEDEDVVINIPETFPITIPESNNFDVPIISGLQSKFPFSIPWDIKNMFKGLRAVRTAPKIDFTWYIRPIDYTWHFSLDLTPFDGTAEIFRTCFLISFILGLCVFSYNHFFGS